MIKCDNGIVTLQGSNKQILIDLILILRKFYKLSIKKYGGRREYAKSFMIKLMNMAIEDKKKYTITQEEKLAYTE